MPRRRLTLTLLLLALLQVGMLPVWAGQRGEAGQFGLGRQTAAESLYDERQLRQPEVGTAVNLGERNAYPSQISHLFPQFARETNGVALIAQCAHAGNGRAFADEIGSGLRNQLLIFALNQLHGGLLNRAGQAHAWR